MNAPIHPLKIEHEPVTGLIPYARNAKLHGPDQVEGIARSIETFGFVNPVLVRPDGSILAGHGRVMAAKLLGMESVPVIRLGHLTDEQARAFILADNRLAEMGGGWDLDTLQSELADLGNLGVSLDWAGFDLDSLMRTGMPILRCRMPLDFPAGLAKALIDEFTPAGGSVLDPCHGWGGRLVGFLLSGAGRYVGFDPSPETAAGVRGIARDFVRYVPGREVQTFEQCFEDADVERGAFDFALTSPPYFDVEKYTGQDQSHRRWSDFDGWDHGFFRVLIGQVFDALRPGGVFALQVGSQTYPLGDRARIHADRCGFEHLETRHSGMHNNYHKTPDEQGEVIVILRKP